MQICEDALIICGSCTMSVYSILTWVNVLQFSNMRVVVQFIQTFLPPNLEYKHYITIHPGVVTLGYTPSSL